MDSDMKAKLLDRKIAIVTGAGRGIGKGIATILAQKGATVLLNDVDEDRAKSACEELGLIGGNVDYLISDVSDPEDAASLTSKTIDKFGDLHILVNNAGVNRDAMMHKMTDDEWNFVISVNLSGVFYCSRSALQHMRKREYGRIINISSAGWQGNIGQANYAAAKAGVIGLTKTIAKENARKGITCNAICPGFIDTQMTRGVPSKVWDAMVEKIPMGYVGKPEDIGKAVAFLASDEASYITSEILNVGGGFVL